MDSAKQEVFVMSEARQEPELPRAALAAARQYSEDLWRLPNVIGFGVGYKSVNGRPTNTIGVVVHVERKQPPASLSTMERIPKELTVYGEKVPTDVVEIKVPLLCQGPLDFAKYRPVRGGCMIESAAGMGTAGGVFFDNATHAPVMLTNNHVLTGGAISVPADRSITQPWRVWSYDQIGDTLRVVPWNLAPLGANYTFECTVDAGIHNVLPGVNHQISIIDIVGKQPFYALPPTMGMRLQRRGITTHLKTDTVEMIGVEHVAKLPGSNKRVRVGAGGTVFTLRADPGQLSGQGGDSGSLAVDAGAGRGLVWAATGTLGGLTWACDLPTVIGALGIITACGAGRQTMVSNALLTVRGQTDRAAVEMHTLKFDRFRARYLSPRGEGFLSGALGALLDDEFGKAIASALLTDDEFAGLLNRAIGPWVVQPTAFDMLEFKLSDRFLPDLRAAFARLDQIEPDTVELRWLEDVFANSEGLSMREVLDRRVPLPAMTLSS
ncbi:hypothetical protein AB0H94_35130 [Streptomyces purpurascens]|uniref:hypothetical protein n=1 Tax=Streptomyces purpurascens TaxID=1924 RepID=UPI00340BCCDA